MARKIIVLERLGANDFNVAYWLDVPAGRQNLVANATLNSQVKDISQTELTDFRAGKFLEVVEQRNLPNGYTRGQIEAALQSRHAALQTDVTNDNRYAVYGSFWDGTTWTRKANP